MSAYSQLQGHLLYKGVDVPGVRFIVHIGRAHLPTRVLVSTHVAMSHRSQQSWWISLPFGIEAKGKAKSGGPGDFPKL